MLLTPILTRAKNISKSLGVKAHPLHAKLQQRQRLKNLGQKAAASAICK